MRTPRYMGVLIVSALCLLGLWPGSLLAQGTTVDRTILRYQQMLQRNPGDARTYYRLGDAYIQKARESGDVTYFNLAEQALRKALEIAPQHSGAARHLAYVFYSRHAFEEAAVQAAKAVELDPTDSNAYGILGDAYQEVGKYEQAQQAYQRMIHIQGDLYSYSRLSGLKSLRGDTKGAIADLERAIQEGQANGRPQESIAWVQWQLGSDHFALGNVQEAEAQYLEALKTYPNYYRALAGLAQVRVAQKRPRRDLLEVRSPAGGRAWCCPARDAPKSCAFFPPVLRLPPAPQPNRIASWTRSWTRSRSWTRPTQRSRIPLR